VEAASRRPPPYPTGAGALAIRGPGGQQTAELETTPLEAELATIKAMVWSLGGRGRGRGRGGYYNPPQTFMPNARPQQQQQHYNQQPQQHRFNVRVRLHVVNREQLSSALKNSRKAKVLCQLKHREHYGSGDPGAACSSSTLLKGSLV
jgi:hypothetical protein